AAGDRGSGEDGLRELDRREDVDLFSRGEDRDRAALGRDADLPAGGDRRCVEVAERVDAAGVERAAGRGIEDGPNPAVLHEEEAAVEIERRGHVGEMPGV